MCVNSRDAECDVRLLYLHGVGDDGTRRDWWPVLQQTSGSDLGSVDIYAPDYSDLLDGRTRAEAPHRTSFVRPHFHLLARRQYRARQSDLHSQLLQSGAESLWPYRRRGFGRVPGVLDAIGEKFVLGVIYDEVGRYVRDDQLRRSIRERVLEVMPTSGRIVIVGHSLGALIALDLLHHLPGDVEIPILITAASSLARRRLPPSVLAAPLNFPYHRVGGWINVFNPSDAVTRGHPIGMRFPQAIDVAVAGSLGDHNLSTCVAEPGVASILAGQLHEPTEVAPWHQEPDITDPLPLSDSLHLADSLMAQRLTYAVAESPGTTSEDLQRLAAAQQVALPGGTSVTNPPPVVKNPAGDLRERMAERDLPAVLVRLASTNPVQGLGIVIPSEVMDQARRGAATDLGIPPDWIEMARNAHNKAALRQPVGRRRSRATSRSVSTITTDQRDLLDTCRDLFARAIVAGQLGQPDAGSDERSTLTRLLSALTDARVGAQQRGDSALAARIGAQIELVATYLTQLAVRGLGVAPA